MSAARMPSSLEIAQAVTPRPILDVAHDLGLRDDEVELYGPSKAKVRLEAIRRLDLVKREELDALAELAANARAGQEAAEARLAAVEARLAALEGTKQ